MSGGAFPNDTGASNGSGIEGGEIDFEDYVEVVEDANLLLVLDSESESSASSDESMLHDTETITVKNPDIIFERHTGSVFCGKIYDKKIITGGEDDSAVIWNAATQSVIEVISFTDSVTGVDITFDGMFASMGDMKGVIQVREMENYEIVFATELGADMMWLKWHPNKYNLFVGTNEGDVFMYSIPAGKCQVLHGHAQPAECGEISGNIAVIGYSDGLVRIFDTNQTKALHSVAVSNLQIVSIDILEEKNLIAVGCVDGRVIVIAKNRGQVIISFDSVRPTGSEPVVEHDDLVSVESVKCFQPLQSDNSPLVAAGNLKGYFSIWDVSRQVLRYTIRINLGISKLLLQNHFIYVACLKGKIYKLDCRSGQVVGKFQGHPFDVLDICLSPDGSKLLSTTEEKLVCVYSTE